MVVLAWPFVSVFDVSIDTATLSFLVMFLANFGAIIWGISTISTTVKSLQRSVTRLDETMKDLRVEFHRLDTNVSVLNDFRRRIEGTPP